MTAPDLHEALTLLRRLLVCMERLVYETGSGRRMEIAEYLTQVVYAKPHPQEDTNDDVNGC